MKIDSVYIAIYSTQIFVLFVCIVGGLRYKTLVRPLQFLEWYIVSSIIIDCIVDVMVYYSIRTIWLWQCFAIVELFLFLKILKSWQTSPRNGLLIWVFYFFYLIVWVIGKFSFEPISSFDVYTMTVSQVIQIGFGSWLLFSLLGDNTMRIKDDPRFWIVSGIVLYATATFFLFGMSKLLLASSYKLLKSLWPFNDAFIVIQYIFFLRAFLCRPVPLSRVLVPNTVGNFQNQKPG